MTITMAEVITETQENPETENNGELKKHEDSEDETQENPETEKKHEDSDDETQKNPETETYGEEAKKPEESDDQSSSPRGVLEIRVSGSDSDNSSTTTSSSRSNSSSSGGSSSAATEKSQSPVDPDVPRESIDIIRRSFRDKLKWKSFRRLSTFPFRRRLGRIQCAADHEIDSGGGDVTAPKPTWRSFTQAELAVATDNFSSEKLIGKGGHAEVYKGCLPDGEIVAVKRVTKKEKNDGERVGEFLSELGIIAHINHPNTAKLVGFSTDGDLHLVLQFSPHGSLASVLHGGTQNLDWRIRFKVAVGIAEGLQYLHYRCQRRMIHRDITASNILLTEDYEPQISDFGLAKWLPENWPHHVVHPIEGTFGYMAPEYFMHGVANEKTDVFAYGVLLLELITGRRAIDSCQQSIVMWGKPLLEKNNVKDVADPRLGDDYDIVEMKRAMMTSLACIHHLPTMRPNMNRVVELLRGEGGVTEVKLKHAGGKTLILETCDMDDYTATSYLNDLNRHRQLILE